MTETTHKPAVEDAKFICCSTHCCAMHGCKYGYKACPVVCGREEQEYPCEQCGGRLEYDVLYNVSNAAQRGHSWALETLHHAHALTVYMAGFPRRKPPESLSTVCVNMAAYFDRFNPRDVALVLDFMKKRMEP